MSMPGGYGLGDALGGAANSIGGALKGFGSSIAQAHKNYATGRPTLASEPTPPGRPGVPATPQPQNVGLRPPAPVAQGNGAGSQEGAHLPEASGLPDSRNTGTMSSDQLNAQWRAAGVGGGPAPDPTQKTIGVAGKAPTQAAAISVPSKPGWQADADPRAREFQRQIAAHRQALYENHIPQDRQMHMQAMENLTNHWGQYSNNTPDVQARMLQSIAKAGSPAIGVLGMSKGMSAPETRQGIRVITNADSGQPGAQGPVNAANIGDYNADEPAAAAIMNDPSKTMPERYGMLQGSMGGPNNARHSQAFAETARQAMLADPTGFHAANGLNIPSPQSGGNYLADSYVNGMNAITHGGQSKWQNSWNEQEKFNEFMRSSGINPLTGQFLNPQ